MFESFKSAASLTKDLREWLIEDTVRELGESERTLANQFAAEKSEEELVTSVMSRSLTLQAEAQVNKTMAGKNPRMTDILFYAKGNKLAHALAKQKGWKLMCEGSQALGYTCYMEDEK